MEELTQKKSELQDDTPVWVETSHSSMFAKDKVEMTQRMKIFISQCVGHDNKRPAKTL